MEYQIIIAYILDIIIGDPIFSLHPIRIIGRAIEFLDNRLRMLKLNLRFAGIIIAILIVGLTYTTVYYFTLFFSSINTLLGTLISSLLIYTSISVKCLGKEGLKIYNLLKKNKLAEARKQLSMIVGRDTQDMDENEIIRATIETIAESTVDGIISPLFYACLGGAPLALAYKAVNTLDSMIGYKNERYFKFGCFSARLDDIANLIPARLSAIIIPIASIFTGMSFKGSIKIIIKDRNKSPSPNSGIPEAGFAGALGIQLGGINYYGGVKSSKPLLGIKYKEKELKDIPNSIYLMYAVSLITISLMTSILLIIS